MAALTNVEASALLLASVNATAYPYTTNPKIRLGTTVPTVTTAMTEVSSGAGYTTGGQAYTSGWTGSVVSNVQQIANSTAISWTNMPAVNGATYVNGIEIWDQAGTPNRKWFGGLSTPRQTNAGDTLTFAIGSLVLSLA